MYLRAPQAEWPAEYGASGIKMFLVNQNRVVLEWDLVPKATDIAKAMIAYGWRAAT